MTSASVGVVTSKESKTVPIQAHLDREIDDLIASLPDAGQLSAKERRGIIARYTAVLEGNFIYWMTGAYLSVASDEARAKIIDNLREEVRDSHPAMMRRFAIAANAIPTDADAQAVFHGLTNVRVFIGRLSAVPIVVTMAFFEGFIQRFMPYLADLARLQGSSEMEYTNVHGVCDITHTQELFRALEAEIALGSPVPEDEMFEGVELLRTLIETIVATREKTVSVKAAVISQVRKIAEDHRKGLPPLTDDLVLLDSGLDSLALAILVARLEDTLGCDPFTGSNDVAYPVTLGDFIRFYEHAAAGSGVDSNPTG